MDAAVASSPPLVWDEWESMDTSLVDIDILVNRIREPRSQNYFVDAVRAYKAGALRTALTSVWVAVVYDIISKYRELYASGDSAVAPFLRKWDGATKSRDVKSLLGLEMEIVSDATDNVQLLSPVAKIHLERLREDRNICAHPTFDTEDNLFEPSVEMVRMHLVNAIDMVLSQAPLQGKAIFEQFGLDVQSIGFPTDATIAQDYIDQRYLSQTRPQRIRNFGVVLTKSLLRGIPEEWEKERHKVVLALTAIRERASHAWPTVSAEIVKMINTIDPSARPRAIPFVAQFPEFLNHIESSCRQALQATVESVDGEETMDYRVLVGVRLPQFRRHLNSVIRKLSPDQLQEALKFAIVTDYWERALEIYKESGSFRGSEANFRDLVRPFAGQLDAAQLDDLLIAIAHNGQNWDAEKTPDLLEGLVASNAKRSLPTRDGRDRFFAFLATEDLKRKYEGVIGLFDADSLDRE